VITIADPAYDSHIAHGDPPAHVEVTLPDGTVVCTAEGETPETMTVFITSAEYDGDLGGIAGADAKCQTLADAAGLDGAFKAWLSSGDDPTDPNLYSPATGFAESDVPYVDTLGNTIADNWDDLTDGDALQHWIVVDEAQNTLEYGTVWVWTNTDTLGEFNDRDGYTYDCENWTTADTSSKGDTGLAYCSFYPSWTFADYEKSCSILAHLYCFEQPEPPETKTVFMTDGTYNGSSLGGLTGADAVCQSEADAAGLPGIYKAWLSAAGYGNSAAERLTHSEVPYVLVDGTQVADNWADLTDGSLDAPIGPFPAGPEIWTGTASDGSFVSGSSDCGAWTSTTGAGAVYGLSYQVASGWTQSEYTYDCGQSLWLYCFEQ
jgi:hypothetical protein